MYDYFYDKIFDKCTGADHPAAEYECCVFKSCNFYQADFRDFRFTECRFENCDLSMSKMDGTVLQQIIFSECKLLGVNFDSASRFGFSVSFDGSQLDNSSLRGKKLTKTVFRNCRLREVDFTEADLTGAVFDHCDLDRAIFHYTKLNKADFLMAVDYTIDPEINQLRGTKFSQDGLLGLLRKYEIVVE